MTTPAPILPGEEDDAACEGCPRSGALDVMWCPAWQKYLCFVCRTEAVATEHRMTLAEKRAMDARAEAS